MKRSRNALFFALMAVFLLTQQGFSAPPVKTQPVQAGAKVLTKNIAEVRTDLKILGIQMRNAMTLAKVEYQVKVKNVSSLPYQGGAKLVMDMKYGVSGATNFEWMAVNPGLPVGPLGPGEETTLEGDFVRKVWSAALRATVKSGDAELGSLSVKIPDAASPEIKIQDVIVSDDHVKISIQNMSDYLIEMSSGVGLQVYGGMLQPDNTVQYSPIGGNAIKLDPRGATQATKNINKKWDRIKVDIFLTHLDNKIADEKIVTP